MKLKHDGFKVLRDCVTRGLMIEFSILLWKVCMSIGNCTIDEFPLGFLWKTSAYVLLAHLMSMLLMNSTILNMHHNILLTNNIVWDDVIYEVLCKVHTVERKQDKILLFFFFLSSFYDYSLSTLFQEKPQLNPVNSRCSFIKRGRGYHLRNAICGNRLCKVLTEQLSGYRVSAHGTPRVVQTSPSARLCLPPSFHEVTSGHGEARVYSSAKCLKKLKTEDEFLLRFTATYKHGSILCWKLLSCDSP